MTANGRTKTRADLIDLLSRSLGSETAAAHVNDVADKLGVSHEMTIKEALRVLETLADEPGLLGIAARFTKARVHMAWEQA